MRMKVFGIAAWIAISLSACKKNVSDEQTFEGNEPATQKAKTWFQNEIGKQPASLKASTTSLTFTGDKPQWDKAVYYTAEKMLIAPVLSEQKVTKFLVIQESGTGAIESGYYVFVLGNGNKPVANSNMILKSQPPADFTGAIIKYGIEGTLISTSHYKSGELTAEKDIIVSKKGKYQQSKDNPDSQNIVPLGDGCEYVTVQWYWQTYVNGILVDELFLFSSTEVICEAGGGGPSQESTCAQQAINFLNEGKAVSILESKETEMSPDSLRSTIRPNWRIYAAGTWFIYSYETIVWSRLSKNEAFAFSSYSTRGDAALGTSVGGVRSYTIISKTPIPLGAAGTSVIVEIDFTVKNQVVCNAVPIDPVTLGYKSNMRFVPPVTVLYGD